MIAIDVSAIYKEAIYKEGKLSPVSNTNRNFYFSTNSFNVAPCSRNFIDSNKFIYFFGVYM